MGQEDEPQDLYTQVNGLRLHYLDWGGPGAQTLFLLHGQGSNCHAWDHFARGVRGSFHVLAPDQRGHGDTDWATDGHDSDSYVEDFARFVDGMGARKFVLLGHSMGGVNAMLYAARYPREVERLIVVDIGPEVGQAGVKRIRSQAGPEEFDSVEEVYRLMRAQDPAPPDDMLRYRARFAVKQLPGGKFTWKYDKALRTPGRAARRPDAAEMWEMLAGLGCPTLVVRGESSDLLSRETARRMAAVIPKATLVEVAGAGHRVPLDNAPGFEKAVREFLGV